jgi:hypothetical protein
VIIVLVINGGLGFYPRNTNIDRNNSAVSVRFEQRQNIHMLFNQLFVFIFALFVRQCILRCYSFFVHCFERKYFLGLKFELPSR